MGITLYIAEKPSMAKDLARALGASKKQGIRWENSTTWVSYCIGHLMEIATPDAHDPKWKRWHPSTLPILPHPLQWHPKTKTKKHLKQLIALMKNRQVSEIINACDAGREGELIFRSIYNHSGLRKPVKRFWVSSLTQSAIKKGIKYLQPGQDFDSLAAAAYCRAEADWLVGMNATRALTARSSELLSIGRVQTPTLAMIVKRHQAIQNFVPEDYWTLEAELQTQQGQQWTARWQRNNKQPNHTLSHAASNQTKLGVNHTHTHTSKKEAHEALYKIKDLQQAQQIQQICQGQIGLITKAHRKEERIPPPQLYHLTALQQAGNRRFGYSADHVLKIAQSLYEKHKLITYPRTDSRYLTPDLIPQIPQVLQALPMPLHSYAQHLQQQNLTTLGGRYVNAKKVGDHHAILPSTKKCNWQSLNQDEQRLYDLIARSLLMALSPPAIDAIMQVEAEIIKHIWSARGKSQIQEGWRSIAPPPLKKSHDMILPYVPLNTPTRAHKIEVQAKQTQAPKAYNEASLLGAMEHAGNQLDEEEFKKVLRGSGLGTPATRANILETLLRRKYMSRQGKTLIPTVIGEALIHSINTEDLKSPMLTAQWEQQLHMIAEGNRSPMEFTQKVHQWVSYLTQNLLQGPRVHIPNAHLNTRNKKSSAKRYSSSNTTTKLSYSASEPQSYSRSGSKSERVSIATSTSAATSNANWRTKSKQMQNSKKQSSHKGKIPSSILEVECPHCKQGTLIKGNRGWGCKRWREGCSFVIWFDFQGIYVPEEEAIRVAHRGQSRLFHEQDQQKWRLCYNPKKKDLLHWESNQSASYQKKKNSGSKRKKKSLKSGDKPWQKMSKSSK